jgi:hypothetical protein
MNAPETMVPGRAGRSRLWWLLAAIVIVGGFGLRFAYHNRGYGHPDEPITVAVVGYMRQSGDWDTNWAKASLEPLLKYDQYNFSSYLHATYFFYRGAKLLPLTAEWLGAERGLLAYRFFSVALGAFVVWQTLRLARRGFGRVTAVLAGGMAAVATLLVQDAHYARPEAFVTVLTLAAVGLCWPRPTLAGARMVAGAFLIGVLVAAKVSMLLLAFLPLVPLVAAWPGRRGIAWVVALPVTAGLGFAAGAPGAVLHPEVFLNGVRYLATHYAGLHPPHSHPDGAAVGGMMARYFGATLGWPALAGFFLGVAVIGWRRRWAELALLAGPVIVFAGYFAGQSVFFERNLSHVVPLFIIVAAAGAKFAADWLTERWPRISPVGPVAILGLLLIHPSVRLTWPLVATEFSGRGAQRHHEFAEAIRARHPEAPWLATLFLTEEPLHELAAHFGRGTRPVLVGFSDYHDGWTVRNLQLLEQRFVVEAVAEEEETFPGLPPCTLLTYHRARERYLLVRGVRTSSAR